MEVKEDFWTLLIQFLRASAIFSLIILIIILILLLLVIALYKIIIYLPKIPFKIKEWYDNKPVVLEQTRLDQLNSDIVHHLVNFFNLSDLMNIRKISPIFDEAVTFKYRLHFKKYKLCRKCIDDAKPILPQIENIFNEIGHYVKELFVDYGSFNSELSIPISEIIHEKCVSLKTCSAITTDSLKLTDIRIPKHPKFRSLSLINFQSDKVIAKRLMNYKELKHIELIYADSNNIYESYFMEMPMVKELSVHVTRAVNNTYLLGYLKRNRSIKNFEYRTKNDQYQMQCLDLAVFGALQPNIQELKIGKSTISLIEFNAFKHLEHLELDSKPINSFEHFLHQLVTHNTVKHVKFCFNLTYTEQKLLSRLSNLEKLQLYTTRYDRNLLESLAVLPKLHSLVHHINDERKKTDSFLDIERYLKLKNLIHLELRLDLDQNVINFQKLANLTHLTHLNLNVPLAKSNESILLINELVERNKLETFILEAEIMFLFDAMKQFKFMSNLKYLEVCGKTLKSDTMQKKKRR